MVSARTAMSFSEPSAQDKLRTELDASQKALEAIGQRRNDDGELKQQQPEQSLSTRLGEMRSQVWELELSQKLLEWSQRKNFSEETGPFIHDEEDTNACVALGKVILSMPVHEPVIRSMPLFDSAMQEYETLHSYCQGENLLALRRTLSAHKYPEAKSTRGLVRELKNQSSVLNVTCRCLKQLEDSRTSLYRQNLFREASDGALLLEWMRPLSERVYYHFMEPENPIKVERLPQQVCKYLRSSLQGIWKAHCVLNELVFAGRQQNYKVFWVADVLNYVVRLLGSVLEHHQFFRHASVAGNDSRPNVLAQAIEELLRFDDFIRGQQDGLKASSQILSIVDSQVVSDTDLLGWWLARESERSLGLLRDASSGSSSACKDIPETFGALFHSIQRKASLVFGGPYLNEVFSPLCVSFLEQIQETATALRKRLVQYPDTNLEENIVSWIQLFHGVKACREQIESTPLQVGREDLLRFAESLEKWEQVWQDALSSVFVESILLENCKLAQYVLQCSHLLSSPDPGIQVAANLTEAQLALETLNATCEKWAETGSIANAIRDNVYNGLSREFTSIVLNHDGMTPVLYPAGAEILHRDLNDLLGDRTLPPECLQLLEMVRLAYNDLGLAESIFSLTNDWNLEAFAHDSRLADEAVSMLRAKGFVWLELPEVLIVLSRKS